MKKFISFFLILITLVLSLSSCAVVGAVILFTQFADTSFEFLHDPVDIKKIEIVTIGEVEKIEDNSTDPTTIISVPHFDVICSVQDTEQFLNDFSMVKCTISFPPKAPTSGELGIRIIYTNDEYDVICAVGQGEYRDGAYYADSGKNHFDETQFNDLINKYSINTNLKHPK